MHPINLVGVSTSRWFARLPLLLLSMGVACEPSGQTMRSDAGPVSDAIMVLPDADLPDTDVGQGTQGFNTLAAGVSIAGVSAFQTLEVPLDDGIPTDARMIPLLTNKDMVIRVGVVTGPAFVAQNIRAVAQVGGQNFEQTLLVRGSSSAESPESYFAIRVDAAAITSSADLRLRLLGEGEGTQDEQGHPATWPAATQATPIGAVESPWLKLTFVVVNFPAAGAESMFDLTPQRLESFRRSLLAVYPVSPDKLITNIRPGTYELTTVPERECRTYVNEDDEVGEVIPCFPDVEMPNELIELQVRDNAPGDVIYLGVSNTFPDFSAYGGVAALGYRPDLLTNRGGYLAGNFTFPNDLDETTMGSAEDREATAYVTELDGTSVEGIHLQYDNWTEAQFHHNTIWHELGHALSLDHLNYSADFENFYAADTDQTFPRAYATLGRAGYDMRHDLYIPEHLAYDFMSYGVMSWISDVNYRLLFDILSSIDPDRMLHAFKSRDPFGVQHMGCAGAH